MSTYSADPVHDRTRNGAIATAQLLNRWGRDITARRTIQELRDAGRLEWIDGLTCVYTGPHGGEERIVAEPGPRTTVGGLDGRTWRPQCAPEAIA